MTIIFILIFREEKVKAIVDDILDKIPDQFNMAEIMQKVEERTPYVIVAFQECERMNNLMKEMKRSLRELDLGLKGELTISSDMEDLSNSLFFDQVFLALIGDLEVAIYVCCLSVSKDISESFIQAFSTLFQWFLFLCSLSAITNGSHTMVQLPNKTILYKMYAF